MNTRVGLWDGVVHAPVSGRTVKPREHGATMVIDKGLGIAETRDLLSMAGEYIDLLKLGFGTSLVYPARALIEKIRLAKDAGVIIYPGGTLTELAVQQGRAKDFVQRVADLGFDGLEVSEGTISLPERERYRLIGMAAERGLVVLSEIGKKDPRAELDLASVPEQVQRDIDAGARFVIIEGRDSGEGVGVYDESGNARQESVEAILDGVADPARIMWEAPKVKQQQQWLLRIGPNANLGNVQPPDVIALEATRQALRGETLRRYVDDTSKTAIRPA